MFDRGGIRRVLSRGQSISLDGREIVLWGTGMAADVNKNTIMQEKLEPVFFVDSDKDKWGTQKWGIDVVSPDEIKKLCTSPVVLILIADMEKRQEVMHKLENMDVAEYYSFDEVILGRHAEELLNVYSMLESEYSRKLFEEIITARIKGVEIAEEYVRDGQYFAGKEFRKIRPDEVFVDCGSYVGDTIEQYILKRSGIFNAIYAFEPVKNNLNALTKRMKRLQDEWNIANDKIHIIEAAVGRMDGKCFMSSGNSNANGNVVIGEGMTGKELPVYSIDSCLKGIDIGFIKADIEGMEVDMLEGASESITRCSPLLAIAIYHRSADLYEIPMMCKRLNKGYKMDIAHHDYSYGETVLYCYR